eukprot:gb/GECG01016321.1/.p1 GENE.gb/GECG01016321.1/~~gb/GECG01016321.1/.p1  ORF type:complete len:131 (+),score=10.37 gb/GECG01016321.1/:1-393(+)
MQCDPPPLGATIIEAPLVVETGLVALQVEGAGALEEEEEGDLITGEEDMAMTGEVDLEAARQEIETGIEIGGAAEAGVGLEEGAAVLVVAKWLSVLITNTLPNYTAHLPSTLLRSHTNVQRSQLGQFHIQ